MPSPVSTAAGAYANMAKLASGLTKPAEPNGSFGDVLKQALHSVNEAGQKSDAQTVALAKGKSNMVDVVTAVAETEVAVDAVVAVRDKVIAAYEEIMRMPI